VGFFLFGLLSHLSSADVKKRGHCSRARMQIKFCKLICTREENVHSIRLLLVHRKRCALKAIVQLAQNFYIQKHCLGFATPSHKIHIHNTSTQNAAQCRRQSSRLQRFLSSDVTSNYALRQTQKVICAFSHFMPPSSLFYIIMHASLKETD
jgi:hypothetical protein